MVLVVWVAGFGLLTVCLFVVVGGFRGFSLGFCLGGGWVAFDCVCCV